MHVRTSGVLCGALVAALVAAGCGGSEKSKTPTTPTSSTHAISGTVTGATAGGVTITLGGAATATATTAADGTYSFTGLSDGVYSVRASRPGYAFAPVTRSVTLSGADQAAQNFLATAAAATYTLSGTISGATGVTVSLTGPVNGSVVTTNASFSFSGLVPGAYTLSAQKAGYTFSGSPQTITVTSSNVTAAAITATAVPPGATYSVSGHVNGAASVLVTLTAPSFATTTTTTNGAGDFAFAGLAPNSYTVTPSKAGYTFAPASAPATVTAASVTLAAFTATLTTYTVGGTISGPGAVGATVTLSGDASMVTSTNGAGVYTFPGVAPGAYTITPGLAGYTFTPANLPAAVSTANVTGKDFGSAVDSTPTYTISGTVSGPAPEGVRIALSTGATTTAAANGTYSFAGLAAGSYTVTPSLPGYVFTPAGPNVVVTSANRTQDFAQASAVVAYSIGGTLSYSGAKAGGRAWVWAMGPGCARPDCAVAGTSVALSSGGTASYTIRGVQNGAYQVAASLDDIGYGVPNATEPRGQSSATVSGGNATANVVLVDQVGQDPTAVTTVHAFRGPGSVFVMWEAPSTADGELASSYRVSWGTDAAATNGGSVIVPAHDNPYLLVSGLTDAEAYYFKVSTRIGQTESAALTAGPVTVGAVAGASAVSGTVGGLTSSSGTLYVLLHGPLGVRFTRIDGPSATQAFTVTGVPDGQWTILAAHDLNGDGRIFGEPAVERPLAVAGNTSASLVAASPSHTGRVRTSHHRNVDQGFEGYQLVLEIEDGARMPVVATVLSGLNLPLPLDLPRSWSSYQRWIGVQSAPAVGDAYRVKLLYGDGTSEIATFAVTGVLGAGAFAQNLGTQTTAPYSAAEPLFTWSAPSTPPASYTYSLYLWGNGVDWWHPEDGDLPSTVTSARYNADGNATAATLPPGQYTWQVTVQDASGNMAQAQRSYTVPDVPVGDSAAFAAALQGTWSSCTFTGSTYQQQTLVVTGSTFTMSLTDFGGVDSTCSGTGTPMFSDSGTASVGAALNVSLGGSPVVGYALDHTGSGSPTVYDVAYIDQDGALYFGDTSGANDGSTALKRPTALDTALAYRKVVIVGAGTADYSSLILGSWADCRPGTPDYADVYIFDGSNIDYDYVEFTTTDGSCGGTATWSGAMPWATYTLGASVSTTFGLAGPSLTAQKLDIAPIGGAPSFDLVYVDTVASPNRLYTGDYATGDGTSDGARPTRIDPTWAPVRL